MTLSVRKLADMIVEAQDTAKPIDEQYRQAFTEAQAYAVQTAVRDEKVSRGSRVVGKKVGLTSRAMQALYHVDRPDFGNLFSDQMFVQGSAIETSRFICPRVEGEIAFIMARDVTGPDVSVADVATSVAGVMACLEFVDSRWGFPVTVFDSIADNAGCGGFLLGSRLVPLTDLDLRLEGMVVLKNGELVSSGTGIEVMGDPLNSVAWLANSLAMYGQGLKQGDIVLSGALTAATPVEKGDFLSVSFTRLGSVSARFV